MESIGTVLARSGTWTRDQLLDMNIRTRRRGPARVSLPDDLAKRDESPKELAEIYGCSLMTIYREIKRQAGKLTKRKPGSPTIELPNIAEEYLGGKSVEVLRKEYDVSGETVRRRLKESGVQLKKGKRSR
jgi:hypothetical protein